MLTNKSIYTGQSFGWHGSTSGEAVFNTGMVGYVESLTDPSYVGQILILTYPLIGNYGVPLAKDHNAFESEKIQIAGLIVGEYSKQFSHWRAKRSLADWLITHRIPALAGVDTRALTQELRSHGTMMARLLCGGGSVLQKIDDKNIVERVSTKKIVVHRAGKKTVILIDCGVKLSIIRSLVSRNVTVIQVPWDFDPLTSPHRFDGIVISNGPGDPRQYRVTIKNIKKVLQRSTPMLGICLGNQLLGLAAGGATYKLKFGHRSQNQPCVDLQTGRCYITSQNHGYALEASSLKKPWRVWFTNVNDGSVEGIYHSHKPLAAVQFHPEANPGPTDTHFVFDHFIHQLK